MKIGQFAKHFNVSIDTVRHYIEKGLLIPEKNNTQYQMNTICLEDMALINELKFYRFSLKEIHKILSLKRLTNNGNNGDASYFRNLLVEKKIQLIEEKDQILDVIHSIDTKINTEVCENFEQDNEKKGVPLLFVPILSCPYCQSGLSLQNASLQGHQIFEGNLHCSCGYLAEIQDGILFTSNLQSSPFKYSIYETDVERWNPGFISLLEKSKLWMYNELTLQQLENKIVLETNIEILMMLPKYLSSLSKNTSYIFTCYSLETIKTLKQCIEKLHPDLSVLYIVNSDLHLPLAHHSIDFFIDSLSLTQYSLIYKESPIQILTRYLKDNSFIIGIAVFYEANSKSLKKIQSIYPTPNPKALQLNFLEEEMHEHHLTNLNKEIVGFTKKPGSYFSYHDENEKMNLLAYKAAYSIAK
ncbi:MerR family transcriptional regulator [Bacillus sp. UNC438CL73TsuS30]|uniref:MerR family transcriptional regulator n=1 Tax=Bacillus sp. UNC438CL73TsuS30 TaxID=1340434 RepID=UPI00047EDD5B|nr:MerR family transcriptional regulator [Bacillus sp. UNC438CL73TsuS30]